MKPQAEREAQAVTIATAIALFLGVLVAGLLLAGAVSALTGTERDFELLSQWAGALGAVAGFAYLALHRR